MFRKTLKRVINWSLANPGQEGRDALGVRPSASGQSVTINSALTISAVWAAVRLLSETIGSLPLFMYARTDEGKQVVPNHPLHTILHTMPNQEMIAMDARQTQMAHVLLGGMSYSFVVRDTRTRQVLETVPLNSTNIRQHRRENGSVRYDYIDDNGVSQQYESNQIWRIAGLTLNGMTGLSVLRYVRESFGTMLALQEQSGKMFANGLQTPLAFKVEGPLSDTSYERLKEDLQNNNVGSRNAFRPLLLEEGMSPVQLGMTAEDAQFLESRKFSVTEVARWYGVPPHMLGDLEKATFSNIEEQDLSFIKHSTRRWLVRIEQSITRDLLLPAERSKFFAEHKLEGILRGDQASRAAYYKAGINDGWLNRNEARVLESRNTVEGLDEFLIPLNMQTVRQQRAGAIIQDIAQMSVQKEISFVRKAMMAGDSDKIPELYKTHCNYLMLHLHISALTALTYCDGQIDELVNSNDWAATLNQWRAYKSTELVNRFENETLA